MNSRTRTNRHYHRLHLPIVSSRVSHCCTAPKTREKCHGVFLSQSTTFIINIMVCISAATCPLTPGVSVGVPDGPGPPSWSNTLLPLVTCGWLCRLLEWTAAVTSHIRVPPSFFPKSERSLEALLSSRSRVWNPFFDGQKKKTRPSVVLSSASSPAES